MIACFFDGWPNASPCDGQLIRAHLIPRQIIAKAVKTKRLAELSQMDMTRRECDQLIGREVQSAYADYRSWVPCCGGLSGLGGHHGDLDACRLRIPREGLPEGLDSFAAEWGLTPWLERTYKPGRETL